MATFVVSASSNYLYSNTLPGDFVVNINGANGGVFVGSQVPSGCNVLFSATPTVIRFGASNQGVSIENNQFIGFSNDRSNMPGFTWSNNSNTGMFRAGANMIGFSMGGSNVVTMSNGHLIAGSVIAPAMNGIYKNMIINGDMRIDQRWCGTTLSNTSNIINAYSVDRFKIEMATGSGTIFARQIALSNTDAPAAAGFSNAWNITVASNLSMLSNIELKQVIEAYNISDLGWGSNGSSNFNNGTLSFWMISTAGSGLYCATAVINTSTYAYYVAPFTYSNNNTWQYVNLTIPPAPSNVVMNTSNVRGLDISLLPLSTAVNSMRNAWVVGTPPIISITPQFVSPVYNSTGGTMPTFCNDRIVFSPGNVVSNSTYAQWFDFGSQTFNMGTRGFSATLTFRFTGASLNAWERIFDFGNGTPSDNIVLCRNSTTNTIQWCYTNGTSVYYVVSNSTFAQNTIYNVAVIYDPNATATGTLYIYINGSVNASAVAGAKATDRTLASTYVGRSKWTPAADYPLNGDIYQLNIYNRVISAAEIAAANTTPSNMFNWHSSSSMFTLTPVISVTGKHTFPGYNSTGGTSPTFNNDRVTFAPGAVLSSSASCQFLNLGSATFSLATVGFSITATFRFTGTAGAWERLVDLGNGQGDNNIIISRAFGNTGLAFSIYNNASGAFQFYPVLTISQNVIYSIAFIYNPNVGTLGTMYYYVNGKLQETFTGSTKPTDRTLTGCLVGKSWWGSDSALNGDIYSLNVYNRVISEDEVRAAYTVSTNITDWVSTSLAGNSISITGVQLEKGSCATPFEFRLWEKELIMCRRYYEKSQPVPVLAWTSIDTNLKLYTPVGPYTTNTGQYGYVPYKIRKMANNGTINIWSETGASNIVTIYDTGGASFTAGINVEGNHHHGFSFYAVGRNASGFAIFSWQVSCDF